MKTRIALLACFTFLVGGSLLEWPAYSQRPAAKRAKKTKGSLSFLARFSEMERRGLEPFKGVTTTDGKVAGGLFPIKSTGVSTEPVVNAAKTFLAGLSEGQRKKTMFPVDDPEWRKWMNQHFYQRQGVGFNEMDDFQRQAAFNLMPLEPKRPRLQAQPRHHEAEPHSRRAHRQLGRIRRVGLLDHHHGRALQDRALGWQIDGHHLIVNYFVLGDQVVMTPTFVGSEPLIAESGIYKGVSVMQPELKKGVAVAAALDDSQRARRSCRPRKPATTP